MRSHVYGCGILPDDVRLKAKALREVAARLVTQSQQLRDKADVLFRESEAVVEERRRALWAALKTHEDIPPTISGDRAMGRAAGLATRSSGSAI